MTRKRLFVVDAMAMAFRNFHAFAARPLSTAAGQPTSAVYGSAIFLLKLIQEERPDYLITATDTKDPTFRHEMYPKYKANRTDMPEDLVAQLPFLYKLFDVLGCKTLRQSGVEADDLIGSLVRQNAGKDLDCYIVSGDKDFLQLVLLAVLLASPLAWYFMNAWLADFAYRIELRSDYRSSWCLREVLLHSRASDRGSRPHG